MVKGKKKWSFFKIIFEGKNGHEKVLKIKMIVKKRSNVPSRPPL